MTSLLLHWLNDELRLHRKVDVVERDLSNGYLLAEILHVFGLETHLDKYEDTVTMPAKIKNMELLGTSLETIGLAFPVRVRRAIMMEDRSAILQFLLQLKEFVQHRGKSKRVSPTAKAVSSRLLDTKAHDADSKPRDVEERFVTETANKFHPEKVEFHKGVNMAVHLRKFEQAQWAAENELLEFQSNQKATQAAESGSGISSLQTHLQDKKRFMKDWDREHHEKWKETQRLYMMAERNDLRLELSLEERARIYKERKLDGIHRDATDGVVNFEKNLMRLGLGEASSSSSNAPPLRAIPAGDERSLKHFASLEKRVEELTFRPSNNVKMMKELRERRKAQLAAEKDRRMRRRRSSGTLGIPSVTFTENDTRSGFVVDAADSSSPSVAMLDSDATLQLVASTNFKPSQSLRDQYLEAKRAELEANYDRLRETGTLRREQDWLKLQAIREQGFTKADACKWEICADAAEALISFAFACASRSFERESDMEELKRDAFLRSSNTVSIPLAADTDEESFEMQAMVTGFLNSEGVWGELVQGQKSPLFDSTAAISSFVQDILSPPASYVLDTTWTPKGVGFKIVCLFTEDELSSGYAKRVALERSMQYMSIDEILQECVQMSVELQKEADQGASLSERERELGALGLKVSNMKQKNAVLPEALAVEVMTKYIALIPRDSGAQPVEDEEEELPEERIRAFSGCVLHNFPRTLEETKLFEKALVENIADEEARSSKLAAFDSLVSKEADENEETTYILQVDAVVCISAAFVPEIVSEERLESSSSTSELPAAQNSKRASIVAGADSKKSSENAAKAEQELENARRIANRKQLEQFWAQTSRLTKIDQNGLNIDVLIELVHLSIDVATEEAHCNAVFLLECTGSALPKQIEIARDERRNGMDPLKRVKWLRASNDADIQAEQLSELVEKMNALDRKLRRELNQRLGTLRNVLRETSSISVQTRQEFDAQMEDASAFQNMLNAVATKLRDTGNGPSSALKVSERFYTELEVFLGDQIDANRKEANGFVKELTEDASPDMVSAVNSFYEVIPSICFVLKEHAIEKIETLQQSLYDQILFLSSSPEHRHELYISRDIPNDAINAVIDLCAPSTSVTEVVVEDVTRILGQIATQFLFRQADGDSLSELPELHEKRVVAAEIKRLLNQVALVCRFANHLQLNTRKVYEKDIKHFKQCILDDLQAKNNKVIAVMNDMRRSGYATWPSLHLAAHPPLSAFAKRLPTNQRAQFLSLAQIQALISAFRAAGRKQQPAFLSQDEFLTVVLATSQEHAFPGSWQRSSSLAGVAHRYASLRGVVSWKKFMFSILWVQFLDFPTGRQLDEFYEQALTLVSRTPTRDSFDVALSHGNFLRIPAWFQAHDQVDRGILAELNELLFLLFGSSSSEQDTKDPAPVQLFEMQLLWCAYPPCDFSIRSEFQHLLSQFSRGLLRVFSLLKHWKPPTQPGASADEVKLWHVLAFQRLLECSGISLDVGKIEELIRQLRSWDEEGESIMGSADSFLRFCDAYDTDLARHFVFINPFEALLHPPSSPS
uniref:Calponin-homology (CH) domain-containing protein n=1 Tax=Globisporangium ultimum (strain ATCC 200006 / CBS 805.95 / DAOM BR144) TaxID=431595 RepID=K3WB56_GLOUD